MQGLSLREAADRVGIDFTYLSKIETGAVAPPSEDVIGRLAAALDWSFDKLMVAADKMPSDIKDFVLHGNGVLVYLRRLMKAGS